MKNDPVREHHETMHALAETFERKLRYNEQRAYVDVSDVYALVHEFLVALLKTDAHLTEEELGERLATLRHDFIIIPQELIQQWRTYLQELSDAQYSGKTMTPDEMHRLLVEGTSRIRETLRTITEEPDPFVRHIQSLRVLLSTGDIERAETQYRRIITEYEALPDMKKRVHYQRFHDIYTAILDARNARQATPL